MTHGDPASTQAAAGPEPKGVRRQLTVRLPIDQYEVYKDEADSGGMRGGKLPDGDALSWAWAAPTCLSAPCATR